MIFKKYNLVKEKRSFDKFFLTKFSVLKTGF